MSEGIVKFFHPSKGYGIIIPADGCQDVFAHTSGLIDDIEKGDTVSYDIETTSDGVSAVNVKRQGNPV